MIFRVAVILLLSAGVAIAQQPRSSPGVVQTGVVSPLQLTMFAANGVIMGAGNAAGGLVGTQPASIGVTNTGTPFCVTDGPTSSPYHQLCLGANANGAGLITYNAYQGATPLPLNCLINNVSVPNCLSSGGGGGGGNVNGPASSVNNDLTSFSGTTGKLIQDSGFQASLLNPFTGDSGSGGVAGITPAPPAGSAAAGKVLGAGGGWIAPPAGLLTLTGVVTGSGTGTINTSFTANSVTNSTLAQAPANTIKGNNTGSTANELDLTVAQVTAMLNVFVGDSGSGGTKGLVIAPASGDGAAGKFLKADGTWTVPAGAGNVTGAASSTTNDIVVFADTTGKVLKDPGVIYTSLAPLASPALTGTPTAPTAAQSTNSSQIATTQFVKSQWIPEPVGWIAGQNPNNAVVLTAGQPMTVQGITGRVEIANGTTATVTVNKAPSGTACASGTILHSGSFNANGTPATNQTLTLVGGITENLNTGDSVCFQTGGGANWASGNAVGTITVYVTPQ